MKIWVSTGNSHKVAEVGAILGPGFTLASCRDLPDWHDVVEDGDSYVANARLKARALWDSVKSPVLADDSGLEVDALDGRPGLSSARYSAPEPTSEKNIDKLLQELDGVPPARRTARFVCWIVFLDAAGREYVFDGLLEGVIAIARSGSGGFGFDPVFFLPDHQCTVAELPVVEKNLISHRGRAVARLREHLLR